MPATEASEKDENIINTSKRTTYQAGAALAAAAVGVSLLLNISVAVWASLRKIDTEGSSVSVFRGQCNQATRLNTWIHLLINALSTILLGGSNYCMQSLAAPSRSDIDKAHIKKSSLKVGVQNIHNFSLMQARNLLLWGCLAVSSIPLHLL